jgi:hypothetical protein
VSWSIKTLSSSLNFDYTFKKIKVAAHRYQLRFRLSRGRFLLSMILIKINMKYGQPELNDAVNEIAW